MSPNATDGEPQRAEVATGLCSCPIDAAFEVIGRKWSLLILRNLMRGDRHFNELLTKVDGLNPKTLSQRLKELEQEHLVVKTVTSTTPVSIEYRLTEKGSSILPILRSMAEWSFQWAPERLFGDGKVPKDLQACIDQWEASLVADLPRLEGVRAKARRRA